MIIDVSHFQVLRVWWTDACRNLSDNNATFLTLILSFLLACSLLFYTLLFTGRRGAAPPEESRPDHDHDPATLNNSIPRAHAPFTRAQGQRLASFICQDGGNRSGRPVRELSLHWFTSDDGGNDESSLRFLEFLEQFIAGTSNEFEWPETLQEVSLYNLPQHVYPKTFIRFSHESGRKEALHFGQQPSCRGCNDWRLVTEESSLDRTPIV